MEVEAESYKDNVTVLRMSLTDADEKSQLVNLLTSFSQQIYKLSVNIFPTY